MAQAHIVDFVLQAMSSISFGKVNLFQRDGALFIVSDKGFGYVTPGFETTPEPRQDWDKRPQPPEILQSTEIAKWVKPTKNGIIDIDSDRIMQISDGEKDYLSAISFGPDTDSFTLKNIFATAEKLAKLKDDGKIRMASHRSGYHSHKYGYACDGMDVWLESARVMDREKYLELMRQREDESLTNLEALETMKGKMDLGSLYERCKFPRGMIVTNNLMASFPYPGTFLIGDRDSWSETTELREKEGRLPSSTHKESPYNINVKLNSLGIRAYTSTDFGLMRTRTIVRGIDRDLQMLERCMESGEKIIIRMNGIHNKLFAQEIDWYKKIRREK